MTFWGDTWKRLPSSEERGRYPAAAPTGMLDPCMAVSRRAERHGVRERIRIGVVPPRLAVGE